MKSCKLSIILILSIIMLVSCKPDNSNEVKIASSNNTQSSNSIEVLKGYSLDELSLKFIANGISVDDPNDCEVKNQLITFNADVGTQGKHNSLRSNFTYVDVVTSAKNDVAVDYVPIMILQGFYKNEINNNSFIYINEKNHKPSQLVEYIVYEDENVVVYDMRFLLYNMRINDYLKNLEQDEYSGLKCEWMSEIYDKLMEKPFITTKEKIASSILQEQSKPIISQKNLLTKEQKQRIDSMINGMIEAGITYNFADVSEIIPAHFPRYFSLRCGDYFEVKMNDEMQMKLNASQIITMFKGDFGVTEFPFKCEYAGELFANAQFGLQGIGCEEISNTQKGNIIEVEIKAYNTVGYHESLRDLRALPHKVKYTFEIQENGNIIIKSGEMLH